VTGEGRSGSAHNAWLDIFRSAVIVLLAFAITAPVSDDTTRFLLMLGVAVVAGLSMRAVRFGWRRAHHGRR